jgi:ABC-type uncharacterized transport system permease subunit
MKAVQTRLIAGVAGVLMGLGGLVLACNGIRLALIDALGPVWGTLAAGGLFLAIAAASFWYVFLPNRAVKQEVSEATSAAAGAVAGLPLDALATLVRSKPLIAVLAAIMIGYGLVRDPRGALRQAQSLVLGLI